MTKTKPKPTKITIKATSLIEHHEELPDKMHVFRVHSRTRPKTHRCGFDLQTGATLCECEAGTYEEQPVNFIEWIEGDNPAPCWHRQAAGEWLAEHGYLENLVVKLRPCYWCKEDNAPYVIYDDQGIFNIGFGHAACIDKACKETLERERFERMAGDESFDEGYEEWAEELEPNPPCPTCNLTLEVVPTETGVAHFCEDCGWAKREVSA